MKIIKKTEDKYDPKGFNINENHKKTKDKYDPNGFDINENHKDTGYIYNLNDFNTKGIHRYSRNKYDNLGFDINGINKDTKNKYDSDGYDINDCYLDENLVRNDISYNINWLKNKDELLKLSNEIIKNGESTETANKKVISSKIFKDFAEDILNGKIRNNNKKEIHKERLDGVENDLTKSK